MEFAIRMILLVAALIGFIIGTTLFLHKKVALFNKLIVYAVGCLLIGQIYEIIITLITHSPIEGLNLCDLATLGYFMFIFSASFGQMDGLVDGRDRSMQKYRLIALLAPLAVVACCIIFILINRDIAFSFINAFIYIPIAAASYYNLKHLIIPDVDFGILKSIRGYNLISFVICILFAVRIIGNNGNRGIVWAVSTILISLLLIALIPVLHGGSKKWTL